jgi:molybdopterin/thiamine biosynthesis adenylyltransferase
VSPVRYEFGVLYHENGILHSQYRVDVIVLDSTNSPTKYVINTERSQRNIYTIELGGLYGQNYNLAPKYNVMTYCDSLTEDSAAHMNVRAPYLTLQDEKVF